MNVGLKRLNMVGESRYLRAQLRPSHCAGRHQASARWAVPRSLAIAHAKILTPAMLNKTPTQPVDVQPRPAEMATPPSQAPKALAALKAE